MSDNVEHRLTINETFARAELLAYLEATVTSHPGFATLSEIQRSALPAVVLTEIAETIPGFDKLIEAWLLEQILATAAGRGHDGPDPMSQTAGALAELVARLEEAVDQLGEPDGRSFFDFARDD